MEKSSLSPALRSELKEYTLQLQRLHDQEKVVREIMTREGVFDDLESLREAASRIPSCYLRFSFYERLCELDPPEPAQ